MSKKHNLPHNSLNFVFHGGPGSTAQEIKDSVSYARSENETTVPDTQWATWEGVLNYYKENEAYLQGRAGQPERRRSAEQEILRSARMAACRSDFDDRSSGESIPGTERDRRSVRYSFLLISRPALRVFFRQKQGDSDEKSVIYLAKLCFIVYPCQTARHKAAECISPF